MANNSEITITIKMTWVKPVVIFICRHIQKKWMLKLLYNFTVARVFANGKLQSKVKLKEVIE